VYGKLTESKLFQRSAECLGEEEVYEADLVAQKYDVRDEVAPARVLQSDGVDKGGEEGRETAPQLEPGETARSLCVRPNLNHVGC